MAGMTTGNMDALTRSEVWSNQLRDILMDDLLAQRFVDWISFPEGTQLTIPSIGFLTASDYQEDQAVTYTPMDTGEFTFTINNYKQSATYITNKAKQDAFYADRLIASFVPKQSRAIQEAVEYSIYREGQPRTGNPAGYQIAGNQNLINNAAHRKVGAGASATMALSDFAYALYALKKANVPQQNLIAIVDPSVEYMINTNTNLTSVANNPHWEGIITTGIGRDMRFIRNVFGFDVYTSNRLPLSGTDQTGASETINAVASGANAVVNLFFAAIPDYLPWVGAWRQMPKVDGEYNKDFQREEYVTTARWGVKISRPDNLVCVLTSTTVA